MCDKGLFVMMTNVKPVLAHSGAAYTPRPSTVLNYVSRFMCIVQRVISILNRTSLNAMLLDRGTFSFLRICNSTKRMSPLTLCVSWPKSRGPSGVQLMLKKSIVAE